MARILVVDKNSDDLELCRIALKKMGYQVEGAQGVESAAQLLRSTPYDLVINGCNPSQLASGKFRDAFQKAFSGVPFIVLLGMDPLPSQQQEFGNDITLLSKDVLIEPDRMEEFRAVIEQAIKTRPPQQPRASGKPPESGR